jgi:hypothetical protein
MAGDMMSNNKIWATFTDSFDIGCRVVKWDEPDGLNFIPQGKYNKRDLSKYELSPLMKQFTVHWSVTYRAKHMYSGLNARGLSCNFMIDDDDVNGYATIYQNLPIMYGGWSQGGVHNNMGPGVEISYMPQAWEKDMYTPWAQNRWKVQPHETVRAPVHGTTLKVFLPTKAQMASLLQLMWGFVELFPHVPAKFPRTVQGFHSTTKLADPTQHTGFVSHYHLKREKIDTAGLDMEKIEEEVELRKQLGF